MATGTTKKNSDESFSSTDEFRRRISELVMEANRNGRPINIGTREDHPHYRFDPVESVSPELRSTAVPAAADEVRRNFPEVRALLRIEDGFAFALKVDGTVAGILTRHPSYEPRVCAKYKKAAKDLKQIAESSSITERLTNIERELKALQRAIRALTPVAVPHKRVDDKV